MKMPFTLLLMIYLLFAFISYDKFELLPLLIVLTVGVICGYFDYSRYLVNKSVAPIVCVLTVILFGSIFVLDLDFNFLLIIVTFSALCMGAIASILFHSTGKLVKNEGESRKLNEELVKSNTVLRTEKRSLHVALFEGEKRESELQAIMNKNVQAIRELGSKNNELSAKNEILKTNLDNIAGQKKKKEDELLFLEKNTYLIQNSLREIAQSKCELDEKKTRLVHREQELNNKIKQQQLVKPTNDSETITKTLSIELNNTRRELVKNEREKTTNAEKLKKAQLSIAVQAVEKRELENKVNDILRQQQVLIVSTEELKNEKEEVQNILHTLEIEAAVLKEENQKNKKIIEELFIANQELSLKDDFLKKWIDIETLLIKHASSDAGRSVDLINHYRKVGKIDRFLYEDLHELRRKRNDKAHSNNYGVKNDETDLKQANDCYARLKRCLV